MTQKVGRVRLWWTRVSQFEFWPFSLFYLPVFIYYAYLALKSRSLFFFTSSNPAIEFGGMMGEKKSDIFDLIPSEYIPTTQLFSSTASIGEVLGFMTRAGLQYPVIVKPDIGDRGWMVEKVSSDETLAEYLRQIEVDFLLQEFVDHPTELGVFYIRHPLEPSGQITSIVEKGFLSVCGDGKNNIQALLEENERALLQVDFTHPAIRKLASRIPEAGETVVIESIGNHSRGTTFFDASHYNSPQLLQFFDELAGRIDSFYFGRFDLRCRSADDLAAGKHFKILELNGAGAEPGHIYQPGFRLIRAYRDVLWHLKKLQEVSAANKRRGYKYWNFARGWKKLREVQSYNRKRTR